MSIKVTYYLWSLLDLLGVLGIWLGAHFSQPLFFLGSVLFFAAGVLIALRKLRCSHCKKILPINNSLPEQVICPRCGQLLQERKK